MKALEIYLHTDLESEIIQPFRFLTEAFGRNTKKIPAGNSGETESASGAEKRCEVS